MTNKLLKNVSLLDMVSTTNSTINDVSKTNDNFIPGGTVIHVKLDGSGDFTNLNDAINFLLGKWTNGSITIKLGSGTFTVNSTISINTSSFNIPYLTISGIAGSSIIKAENNVTTLFSLNILGTTVCLKDFKGIGTDSTKGSLAEIMNGFCIINNITCESFWAGIYADWSGVVRIANLTATNCDSGILSNTGSKVSVNGTLNFTNVGSGLHTENAGIIQAFGLTTNYSNVTYPTNPVSNTPASRGLILI